MEIAKGTKRLVIIFVGLGFVIKLPINWEGVKNNFSEFIFYLKTRHILLTPTYFSLLGLMNIQKYSKALDPYGDMSCIGSYCVSLFEEEYDEFFKSCPHHFADASNFSISNDNKLLILDYGGKRIQKSILKFGVSLYERFNLAACQRYNSEILGQEDYKS